MLRSFSLSLVISAGAFAQQYPQGFFRMPVDSTVLLSGNFGEIRHDHFHYGWDIKTGGKEGVRVLAAGDGYVSRLRAGPGGYGKAIYITHPNGYVTVYAHLSAFNDSIGHHVKKMQYEKELYEVDFLLDSAILPVKKGELIGLSGNTGFSEAPHLHFEIRDAKTEEIINPYFFGLNVTDKIKPFFSLLAVYPLDGGLVNGSTEPVYLPVTGKPGAYKLFSKDSIVVSGSIGFGLEVFDSESGSSGLNQVYSLELQVDGKTVYAYEMTRFAFDQTRYVNCHIDYKAQRAEKETIQKAFLLPGNKFPVYKNVKNNGIIDFKTDSMHTVKFLAKDYYGNASEVTFAVKSKGAQINSQKKCREFPSEDAVRQYPLKFDSAYSLDWWATIQIPPYALFENTCFTIAFFSKTFEGIQVVKLKDSIYSLLVEIEDKNVPLFQPLSLAIPCDTSVHDSLKAKLLIIQLDDKGNFTSKGGQYKNGRVSTKLWNFGTFAIAMDTTAPKIREPKLPKGGSIAGLKTLEFKISDELSGIKTYRVEIDGKWILFEYEPKKRSLFCKTSDLPAGKHTLKVEVSDSKGNKTVKWLTYAK
ncbi:MAG: M23 family metallopeptidase [Bacteroidota bacterium]